MKDKKEIYFELHDNFSKYYDDFDIKSLELLNKFIFESITLEELKELLCEFLNLKGRIFATDYNKYQIINTIKELKD